MAQNYRKRDVRMIPDPNNFIWCNACSIDFNQNFSIFRTWLTLHFLHIQDRGVHRRIYEDELPSYLNYCINISNIYALVGYWFQIATIAVGIYTLLSVISLFKFARAVGLKGSKIPWFFLMLVSPWALKFTLGLFVMSLSLHGYLRGIHTLKSKPNKNNQFSSTATSMKPLEIRWNKSQILRYIHITI